MIMATGNMKVIKRRIKSVSSTMQITKAMELVASSKLRRARKKSTRARPYFENQVRTLTELAQSKNIETRFTRKRESEDKRYLYIVVAGDRGLAGGYNSGMFKLVNAACDEDGRNADGELRAEPLRPKIIAVGKKAVEYFEKRDDVYDIVTKHSGVSENIRSGHCSSIANTAIKLFSDGDVDEVKLFYTKYVSSMVQEATVMRLLPVSTTPERIGGPMRDLENEEFPAKPKEITYDPSPEVVFDRVVPCFLMSILQCAITESYASEQCARRVAMENASDNAEEMIDNLSLLYNRARQEKITNEINEIVGGANAL
jgi:F-type H+-transporting ATPase subunit gamma